MLEPPPTAHQSTNLQTTNLQNRVRRVARARDRWISGAQPIGNLATTQGFAGVDAGALKRGLPPRDRLRDEVLAFRKLLERERGKAREELRKLKPLA